MTAGQDNIAGTLGSNNRMVGIGKDLDMEDRSSNTNAQNYFDFGRILRERLENGDVEDGMGEISRLVREFYSKIALLEYRVAEQERKFNIAAVLIGLALVAILWKLYFGG